MKKALLTIGTLSTAIIPAAAVISCGSSHGSSTTNGTTTGGTTTGGSGSGTVVTDPKALAEQGMDAIKSITFGTASTTIQTQTEGNLVQQIQQAYSLQASSNTNLAGYTFTVKEGSFEFTGGKLFVLMKGVKSSHIIDNKKVEVNIPSVAGYPSTQTTRLINLFNKPSTYNQISSSTSFDTYEVTVGTTLHHISTADNGATWTVDQISSSSPIPAPDQQAQDAINNTTAITGMSKVWTWIQTQLLKTVSDDITVKASNRSLTPTGDLTISTIK